MKDLKYVKTFENFDDVNSIKAVNSEIVNQDQDSKFLSTSEFNIIKDELQSIKKSLNIDLEKAFRGTKTTQINNIIKFIDNNILISDKFITGNEKERDNDLYDYINSNKKLYYKNITKLHYLICANTSGNSKIVSLYSKYYQQIEKMRIILLDKIKKINYK